MALYAAYPKNSTAARRARAARKAVDGLRSELDNAFARETPHDRRYWASRVYYGMTSPDAWESEVLPILAQHHAEHPNCDVTCEAIRDWVLHDLLTRAQRVSPVCYVTPKERYGAAIRALSYGEVGRVSA